MSSAIATAITPRITTSVIPATLLLDRWPSDGAAPVELCGCACGPGSALDTSETKFVSTAYGPCERCAAKLTDASVAASPRGNELLPASNREPTMIA